MKSYSKITILLLFSLFITIFVSPIIASIVPFNLYRIMGRVILISTFILFFYYKDRLGFQNLRILGFEFNKRWWLLLFLGLLLGLFTIGIVSLTMLHLSIRFIIPDILSLNWLRYLIGYLIVGFTAALIEECFFRGFILQALLKDTGFFISLIITNIFYSIVHFLKPLQTGNIEILNLFSSINAIPLFFKPLFINLPDIWPLILGLFLVGIVLSMAYLRVRTLSMSIGIHAGWIIGVKSLSLGTDVTDSGSLWVSGNVIAHPFTWLVLLIFILILGLHSYGFKRFAKKT